MSQAESLRVACAIAQVPGYSPSATSKGMLSLWGKSLNDLPAVNDAALQHAFGWNSAQIRSFRVDCEESLSKYRRIADRGIGVSTLLDEGNASWQNHLISVPMVFYFGEPDLLNRPSIGFSGSRDATDHAISITNAIATEAARLGMTLFSGGARGVDLAAHCAAISAGGTTVMLVPQGLDTWRMPISLAGYPEHILVISMDLPWADWTTPSAMQRNRAIVDLSGIITIPQAGTTGGSHTTGMYALSRNRNLWVADLGPDYPGNKLLLQRGAKPLPWIDGVPDFELMRQASTAKPAQQSLF